MISKQPQPQTFWSRPEDNEIRIIWPHTSTNTSRILLSTAAARQKDKRQLYLIRESTQEGCLAVDFIVIENNSIKCKSYRFGLVVPSITNTVTAEWVSIDTQNPSPSNIGQLVYPGGSESEVKNLLRVLEQIFPQGNMLVPPSKEKSTEKPYFAGYTLQCVKRIQSWEEILIYEMQRNNLDNAIKYLVDFLQNNIISLSEYYKERDEIFIKALATANYKAMEELIRLGKTIPYEAKSLECFEHCRFQVGYYEKYLEIFKKVREVTNVSSRVNKM
jgi:hypothetical protein